MHAAHITLRAQTGPTRRVRQLFPTPTVALESPPMPDSTVASTATTAATLQLDDGQSVELPVVVGAEGERAVDITTLRDRTGYITLDPGYRNTGSCESAITFIDADKGILRYRGYSIEDLAQKSNFLETSDLLIYGEMPSRSQLEAFTGRVIEHSPVNEHLLQILDGFPRDASPMAMLSACVNGLVGYHPEVMEVDHTKHFDTTAAKLIGKTKTLAAAIYRHRNGQQRSAATPDPKADYTSDFMRMITGRAPVPEVAKALKESGRWQETEGKAQPAGSQ